MKRQNLCVLALALLAACSDSSADSESGGPGRVDASGECTLKPGDYMIEYSIVSDTCEIGTLPSELMSVASDGAAAQSLDTPNGCSDSAPTVAGCSASFRRVCTLPAQGYVLTMNVAYAYDYARGTGTVNVQGRITDPGTGSVVETCSTAQRAEMSRLN